ncbi:MAG: peptidylprolyl isomerase [Bryobacteraceae bacterium]
MKSVRAVAIFGLAAIAVFGQPKKGVRKAAASPLLHPEALAEKAPAQYKVKLSTGRGDATITVHRDWAPLAADRFYNLVKNGFYNGSPFHRVMPGFVAQFGIHPTPAVNAAWRAVPMKDEPVKKSNTLGTIGFAADGANSRTTQIYINLKQNTSLDRLGFVPFGDITQGFGVTALIYSAYHDKPDAERAIKSGLGFLKRSFPNLDYVKSAAIE